VRGLLVGRFQPFHLGHAKVVRAIQQDRPSAAVVLAIGSADESFTWTNPFTAGERFEMIDRTLGSDPTLRVHIVPVADIHRHAQWVRYLESMLPSFDRVYTNNPLTRQLFEREGYAVESPPWFSRKKFEGAHIRTRLASGRGWRPLVPPPVAEYLAQIDAPRRLAMLRGSATSSPAGVPP
jgi:nicotinamide-nucleotide adenylyltransferase